MRITGSVPAATRVRVSTSACPRLTTGVPPAPFLPSLLTLTPCGPGDVWPSGLRPQWSGSGGCHHQGLSSCSTRTTHFTQ